MKTVKFRQMKVGDAEDYAFHARHEIDYAAWTGERVAPMDADLAARRDTGAGNG